MAWWNAIGGVLKGGKDVAEVFVENKENKGARKHEQEMVDSSLDLASLTQFSTEFHVRENGTRWDSFVDGLNRLPRPLITISILSFFVLAPLNPARFLEIAKAYELMPPGYWALLSVVIGFYFGGRMQLKSQDMTLKKDAVQAAKDLMQMKMEFRKMDDLDENPESKVYDAATKELGKVLDNKVIADWLKSKSVT